jgi:hypothetical protein
MVAWTIQEERRTEEVVAVEIDTLCARDVSLQNKQPQPSHRQIIAGIRLSRATPVLALE